MQALENRIPPPLVAVLFAVLMGLLARGLPGLDPGLGTRLLLALPLVMAGLLFVLAGGLAFRRAKTTVNPLKPASASALVTSGIYQYTRNPMYVSFALWLSLIHI